jgi:prepilin-type processing-associated H-X9-DG protein
MMVSVTQPQSMKPQAISENNRTGARREGAFTLVELLASIGIMVVLAAILIPVVGGVRESSRSSRCASNLRSLGIAYLSYLPANKGVAPYENWTYPTWISSMMPDAVGRAEYDAHVKFKRPFEMLTCPSSGQTLGDYYQTDYALNQNAIAYPSSDAATATFRPQVLVNRPADIILAMDFHSLQRVVKSTNLPATPDQLDETFRHRGRANVVYLDGHVSAISSLSPLGTAKPWRDW